MPERPHNEPLSDTLAGLPNAARDEALRRFEAIAPNLYDDVAMAECARAIGLAPRTLFGWRKRYLDGGLVALTDKRSPKRGPRIDAQVVSIITGLALGKPRLSAAAVHRKTTAICERDGHAVPSYATTYRIIRDIDPALSTLALDGAGAYRDRFELVHIQQADAPNAIWQSDHCLLKVWVDDPTGQAARPWLTVVMDDHSRAIAGARLFFGAPSALHTSLALRDAIWGRNDPAMPACGLPDILYVDHGTDYTSKHLAAACADLRIRPIFSAVGRPQGRGKVERFFRTVREELLSETPGYAGDTGRLPKGRRLSIADFETIFAEWVRGYNDRDHSSLGRSPNAAWRADGWIPRLPDSLEDLNTLLVQVARPRVVRRDGIHFKTRRYMSPTLAPFVGQSVVLRFDPRDLSDVRVFHEGAYLCRAVSHDTSGGGVGLPEIKAARDRQRRKLSGEAASYRKLRANDWQPEPDTQRRLKRRLALYEEDLQS